MQLARLQRPRASQGFYGNAPGLPGAGATMTPPAPTYPRMSTGAAATMAPLMPTPAAPVTTNPSLTPFQLSVNNQRATEARKAATFAAGAPLPYAPISPGATPAPMPQAPAPASVPGAGPTSTGPVNLAGQVDAPAAPAPFVSRAPAGQQYSGANGVGLPAEQTAQAARDAYVQSHNDTANAIDRGPGLGVGSYANAELQQDANTRANEAATTPNAKDEYYQAGAAERQARADTLIPAQAEKAKATGVATTALVQPKVDNLKAGTDATKAKGEAATANAATNAKNALTKQQAEQDRKLSEQVKTLEQKIRGDNRLSESAKRAMIHQKIGFLTQKMKIAIGAGIRTDDKGGINDQIQEAIKEIQPAAQAPATQPAPAAGQAASATQPSASAIQPKHINPTTGQKYGLDPVKHEWVEV